MATADPLIEQGGIVIECGITTPTWERERRVDFSIPFFENGTRVLAFRNAARTVGDIADKRIGAIGSSTTMAILRASIPGATLVEVPDMRVGLEQLLGGELDGLANLGVVLRAQIEGLVVDQGITVCDLKATLDYLFQSLLGPGTRTRFRPHYFGYTEPSFEVDFAASHLSKVGKEWIEIMGCGMVDPLVLEEVGLDPAEWSGFAFGLGIERIAMTLYGVDDIRHFYANDLRFLRQF